MNRRDLARNYFKKCGLTYQDIGIEELNKLIKMLNKHISDFDSCMIMIKEPENIVLDKNKKIKFAELRVKGAYFDDREAITFNQDGFIGFCGWADGHNLTPFVMAFVEWCEYLKENKLKKENQKLRNMLVAIMSKGEISFKRQYFKRKIRKIY